MTKSIKKSIYESLSKAKVASRVVALLGTSAKNTALKKIAAALIQHADEIARANAKDLLLGEKNQLGEKLDRLRFDQTRVRSSAAEVRQVARLPDPVGRVLERHQPLAGFDLTRVTVPLGVVAMIYESRPNVTIDATVLALKSGNAVVLRGSADALTTNRAIVKIIHNALRGTRIPPSAVQLIDTPDRAAVAELITARGLVDVVIPRGGRGLIDFVSAKASVPCIETGASVVHLFVDASADLALASRLVLNSKTRRVSICNALDTLLLHEKIAAQFWKRSGAELARAETKLHFSQADAKRLGIDQDQGQMNLLGSKLPSFVPLSISLARSARAVLTPQQATPSLTIKYDAKPDFDREWLSNELNIKIVKDLDMAIEHIRQHSLGHTEAIVTRSTQNAKRFTHEIDAACVFVNLSTQFSDGAQFGLGAEIGISTQKMHARGPFALEALTSYKWVGCGKGQARS